MRLYKPLKLDSTACRSNKNKYTLLVLLKRSYNVCIVINFWSGTLMLQGKCMSHVTRLIYPTGSPGFGSIAQTDLGHWHHYTTAAVEVWNLVNHVICGYHGLLGNRPSKSHEILMFVCLQKDAKQCCDHKARLYSLCWPPASTMSTIELCGHSIVWRLFGDK